MKKIFSLLTLCAGTLCAYAQNLIIQEPKTEKVTIYLQGASIQSVAHINLAAGANEVVLTGLPADVDTRSLQVAATGSPVILGVSFEVNNLEELPKTAEQLRLTKLRDEKELERDKLKSVLEVYQKEEALLDANKETGGENEGVSATGLEEVADFYRERLTELRTNTLVISRKLKDINEELNKIHKQLREANALAVRPKGEVHILVSSGAAARSKFSLTYYYGNAGWNPLYDIRVEDTKSPTVKITQKSEVWQSTGISWDNVRLTLSTGNPSLSGSRPLLYPWSLDIYQPQPPVMYRSAPAKKGMMLEEEEKAFMSSDESYDIAGAAETIADYTQVTAKTTATEFEISLPYTVPGNAKRTMVEVRNYTIPSSFSIFTAPKLDPDAYITAMLTGYEAYNLLPGTAGVYFEGAYVGETYLNTGTAGSDTLSVSLGREQGIIVKREKVKEFTSKKIIGSNVKEDFAYEITVKNTKSTTTEVTVEDQLPISRNSAITVENVETNGGTVDATDGKVTWKLKVPAGQSQKVILKFSVKYPKNKVVTNL